MCKPFYFKQFNLACHLSALSSNVKKLYLSLSDATIPGQSGTGSDSNKGIPQIPQSSSITGCSPSDCVASYQGHSLVGVLPLLQRRSRFILRLQLTGLKYEQKIASDMS